MQYKEYHHTGNINKRKTIYLTRKKYFKLKKKTIYKNDLYAKYINCKYMCSAKGHI